MSENTGGTQAASPRGTFDAEARPATEPGAVLGAGPSGAAAVTATAAGTTEPDWTDQVTDLIVDTVDKVRDRTTGPVLDISHASVHAVVAALLLLPVGALLLIGLVRVLNWAIPGDVWFIYAGLGTIFCLAGVLLWSKREPRRS